jgi:hypothetical protein
VATILRMRLGRCKTAGKFFEGELAYDEDRRAVLLCTGAVTFRRIFSRIGDRPWRPIFGRLVRFRYNREFRVVYLDDDDDDE